jgi:hypothetical protein
MSFSGSSPVKVREIRVRSIIVRGIRVRGLVSGRESELGYVRGRIGMR